MRIAPLAFLLPALIFIAPPIGAAAVEPATGLSGVQQVTYADAVQSFRAQRYAAAYARFARLADAGHAPSAQLALVMQRNGPALFGSDWSATLDQQRRWNALVINGARGRLDLVDNERGD
jgi:hypothetical protein